MSLDFKTLAATNWTRCKRWHNPFGWSPQMWGLAAAGEMGELCNARMEIGDVVVYLDLLAQRMGMRLEDCVVETFNRVSERESFPERLP